MKNVKFISCRETPEGYLLRETSTGVVLEKYHTTNDTSHNRKRLSVVR